MRDLFLAGIRREAAMTFFALHRRLVAAIELRIRNGNLSERGFARKVGVSQSHIHNVLKGARALSPAMCDRILEGLELSLLDLLEGADRPEQATGDAADPPPRGRSRAPVPPSSAS
jgi:transcriptional regulator with XRE-family HTH domain